MAETEEELKSLMQHAAKSNLEKEEQYWRSHVSWFKAIFQSCIKQNSIVLV